VLFNLGLVLQALEARREPPELCLRFALVVVPCLTTDADGVRQGTGPFRARGRIEGRGCWEAS